MIEDAQGHRLSGATAVAAATYDRAVRAFNLVHGDSVGLFDKAREAAPDFAMATLGKAWVFAIANDPGLMTKAAALVETARGFALNEREQAHLAAFDRAVNTYSASRYLFNAWSYRPRHAVWAEARRARRFISAAAKARN